MPKDEHYRAAQMHNLAAHAHMVAATHHDKEDHMTGHEYSKQAMEHSAKAHEASQAAIQKSTETNANLSKDALAKKKRKHGFEVKSGISV